MKPYEKPFYLEGNCGNNAFSYQERGQAPTLYVPALREGSLQDLDCGEKVVFSDVDEHGVLQKCSGLKSFLRSEWEGIPLIVVDNHNHVFYFWMEAFLSGKLLDGAFLVHVDGHKDMREPLEYFDEKIPRKDWLEAAFEYTNRVLNVGNYIVPAMKVGLIREAQFVTSEAALEERPFFGKKPKILNLDLDFFARELDYIPFGKARDFILKEAAEASLITVSTSPFFIEQERALHQFHQLFG